MIEYCHRCVMPSTKPNLSLDEEGICSACRSFEERSTIDWQVRQQELESVLSIYRNRAGTHWDCIIPVSGGKDSTFQVIKMLEMGMNPLCVLATTCDPSELGRNNIENVKQLGVDFVEFSPNPLVRRKLNRIGLTRVGDISWPEHVGIFTIPVRAAVQYRVPLIIWGENSQNEYGGPAAARQNKILDRKWLMEYGGLLGLQIQDLIGIEDLELRHLIPYSYPGDDELQQVGVTGIFLGYYLPWDGYRNALVAQAYGFTTYHTTVEGSLVNYENLDNYQTGIHDYFKFLKLGFGRATDLACLHVRRGRLTREEALAMVRKHDGKFPWTYLGKPLADILAPLELSVDQFIEICDRYTNKDLFKLDAEGKLIKDKVLNLTKINYDNI